MLPVPNFVKPDQQLNRDDQSPYRNVSNHRPNAFPRNSFRNNRLPPNKFHQQMIQCDYDDCRFRSANMDEMMVHKKINHFQLCNRFSNDFLMDSPDEISKWRAERRSKYPRLSNVTNGTTDDDRQVKQSNTDNNNRNRRFHHPYHNSKYKSNYHKNNDYSHKRKANYSSPKPIPKSQSPKSDEKKSESISSLNLISGYGSDSSDENSDNGEEHGQSSVIISSIIDELLDKLEKNLVKNKKRPKIAPKPHQIRMQYTNLNLFQKLMLQDVRKIKTKLLQTLKFIADHQYLQSN